MLVAQESEAKESFGQLEMLQRTHDKLRSRADQLEVVHDALFSKLEIVKKTLMVSSRTTLSAPTIQVWARDSPWHGSQYKVKVQPCTPVLRMWHRYGVPRRWTKRWKRACVERACPVLESANYDANNLL